MPCASSLYPPPPNPRHSNLMQILVCFLHENKTNLLILYMALHIVAGPIQQLRYSAFPLSVPNITADESSSL